jgi:hypothetical protein
VLPVLLAAVNKVRLSRYTVARDRSKVSSDDLPLDAALTVSTLRAVLAVRPALAG